MELASASPDDLRRRIVYLEEELEQTKAEVATVTISWEHHSKRTEETQAALATQQERSLEEIRTLQSDNSKLNEELNTLRTSLLKLQAAVVEKDAALEQRATEVDQLHVSKRSLDKLLEHKQAEFDDVHVRLKTAMDKIVALTSENKDLDAKAHEAQAQQNRSELTRMEWEHEKEVLERHATQLNEELTSKAATLQSLRQRTSAEIMELEQKLQDTTRQFAKLQASETDLQDRLKQEARASEALQKQLREVRDRAGQREEHFEKELATAQKLAALYKSTADGRTSRCTELEGIVRELKEHVQESDSAHKRALALVEEQLAEASKSLDDERAQRRRMLEAASAGHISVQALTAGSPEGRSGAALPEGMSITTLFAKYTEASEAWRAQQLKNRQNEIILEQLVLEVEKKAVLVREQNEEHLRLQAAYSNMAAALEAASQEKRSAQAHMHSLEAQSRRDARHNGAMEQTVVDMRRQIAILLRQVEQLQGREVDDTPAAGRELALVPAGQQTTADDIIGQQLVTFSSLEELVQVNAQQLVALRALGAEQEADAAEKQAQLTASHDQEVARMQAQLDSGEERRLVTEDLMKQLLRQRDMYKLMASQPSAASATGNLVLTNGSPALANGHAAPGPDYQQLLHDSEADRQRERSEAAEHHRLLQEELTKTREEATTARAEGRRGQAEAEFERSRSNRLDSQLNEQSKNADALMQSSARYQVLVTDLHTKVAEAIAARQTAQEALHTAELNLQKEVATRSVLEANLERAHRELAEANQERISTAGQLQATKALSASAETDFVRDRARLNEETARLQRELSENLRVLSEEKRKSREAAITLEAADSAAQQRVAKAEADATKAQEALAQAQQAAANAEVKSASLQKALQKAEEARSSLEVALNARQPQLQEGEGPPEAGAAPSPTPSTRPVVDRTGELEMELKLLRVELAHAQEAQGKAQSWHQQSKAMAQASDDACAAFQEKHDKYKAEADARAKTLTEEADKLRSAVSEGQREVEALRAAERSLKDSVELEKQQLRDEIARLNANIEGMRRDSASAGTRIERLNQDVAQLRREKQSVQSNYEQQVIEHGNTAKRLTALDVVHTTQAQELSLAQAALHTTRAAKATLEESLAADNRRWGEALEAAQRHTRELEGHNEALLKQLEQAADRAQPTATSDGGEGLGEVVRWLRQERETARQELALSQQEAHRLRQDSARHQREAAAALAEAQAIRERTHKEVQGREEHQAHLGRLDQLNLLRESNTTLRNEKSHLANELSGARQQAREADRRLETAMRDMVALRAAAGSHADEVTAAKETAARWEQRCQELQSRYDRVDLREHQLVQTELANAKQIIATHQQEADQLQGEHKKLQDQFAKLNDQRKRAIDAVNAINLDKDKSQAMVVKKVREDRQRLKEVDQELKDVKESLKQKQAELDQVQKSSGSSDERIKALQDRVAELEQKLSSTDNERQVAKLAAQRSVASMNESRQAWETKVAQRDQQIQEKVEQLKAAQQQINQLQQEVSQLQQEISQLQAALSAASAAAAAISSPQPLSLPAVAAQDTSAPAVPTPAPQTLVTQPAQAPPPQTQATQPAQVPPPQELVPQAAQVPPSLALTSQPPSVPPAQVPPLQALTTLPASAPLASPALPVPAPQALNLKTGPSATISEQPSSGVPVLSDPASAQLPALDISTAPLSTPIPVPVSVGQPSQPVAAAAAQKAPAITAAPDAMEVVTGGPPLVPGSLAADAPPVTAQIPMSIGGETVATVSQPLSQPISQLVPNPMQLEELRKRLRAQRATPPPSSPPPAEPTPQAPASRPGKRAADADEADAGEAPAAKRARPAADSTAPAPTPSASPPAEAPAPEATPAPSAPLDTAPTPAPLDTEMTPAAGPQPEAAAGQDEPQAEGVEGDLQGEGDDDGEDQDLDDRWGLGPDGEDDDLEQELEEEIAAGAPGDAEQPPATLPALAAGQAGPQDLPVAPQHTPAAAAEQTVADVPVTATTQPEGAEPSAAAQAEGEQPEQDPQPGRQPRSKHAPIVWGGAGEGPSQSGSQAPPQATPPQGRGPGGGRQKGRPTKGPRQGP